MCVLFGFCVCSDAFVWFFAVVIVVAFYVVFLFKKLHLNFMQLLELQSVRSEKSNLKFLQLP